MTVAAFIAALSSCQEKETGGADTLEVTPAEISFAAQGNEDVLLTVTTNAQSGISLPTDGLMPKKKATIH